MSVIPWKYESAIGRLRKRSRRARLWKRAVCRHVNASYVPTLPADDILAFTALIILTAKTNKCEYNIFDLRCSDLYLHSRPAENYGIMKLFRNWLPTTAFPYSNMLMCSLYLINPTAFRFPPKITINKNDNYHRNISNVTDQL